MTKYFPVLIKNETTEDFGKWAVGSGRTRQKYYPTTVCKTEREATAQAIEWNMRDLFDKIEKLYDEAVEADLMDPHCMMDYLC